MRAFVQPNADAKCITLEGDDRRIVIVAKRHITAGEEVTYDYKFEYEEDKLRCLCGAKSCRGSMN
jgi:histone-lysine N-methyltransferase SETD1